MSCVLKSEYILLHIIEIETLAFNELMEMKLHAKNQV